jgi:hypothetical protein
MSSSLTDRPEVKQLVEMFDCAVPASHRLVVTDWSARNLGGHTADINAIVIRGIDVYTSDNVFVKQADLGLLKDSIQNFSVIFQKQKE